MAQYQVPQFIEVEDKIFGPLTFKQFVYLAGGGGLCLIFFSLLPLYVTVILSIPVIVFCAALAFYEVNGRPLINAVEHAFSYVTGHKLYLWRADKREAASAQAAPAKTTSLPVPRLSESKLKDLSWSLNIKDRTQLGVTDRERDEFAV